MKKKLFDGSRFILLFFFLILVLSQAKPSLAHFGIIIPSSSTVESGQRNQLEFHLQFMHPFEFEFMNLERPIEFGLVINGKKRILTKELIEYDISGHKAWKALYTIKEPGDHIFYMILKPYWEPSEDKYIQHITKVIVGAYGLEDNWSKPVGLKAEMVPLTRPYGLWEGNLFCAKVLYNGKPAPNINVEVEYYNDRPQRKKAPSEYLITQVVKTDDDGQFCYAIPWAGWWGFAGLLEDPKGKEHKGKRAGLEMGAVIWIETIGKK